jgi:hypothetical protein
MPIRFQRRITIVPSVRINLGKRSVSISVGRRGAWLSTGTRGNRGTLGVPGTGLSWFEEAGLRAAGSAGVG